MSDAPTPDVVVNPWQALRRLTPARLALGRTGVSQPTAAHLAFELAHAQARDAVHLPLDVAALLQELEDAGVTTASNALPMPPIVLDSAATDRACYLQRPDFGRRLDQASRVQLESIAAAAQVKDEGVASQPSTTADLALVLADGLSAQALQRNAPALLAALLPLLGADGWQLAPLSVVRHARVAIGDEIGALLGAQMVAVLIGERPGLSSPDSLGIYLTWQPVVGTPDARRNCISNVRPAGLPPALAAQRLHYLLTEARRRQLSGVGLKDASDAPATVGGSAAFLLAP